MHAPLTTPRQQYYQLMALVCEDLPTTAVDTLVRQGHEATAEQLRAVRQSRKTHLGWLIDLVRVGLPDFVIPAELLPVVPVRRPAPLFH
ncbi:hypothetical protein Q5H93_12285 [Hymenobacter sp. ASUV-10]|uniref:Uncharacterized protein n=1 Tax=Hymenobacter aranciens TaxID=3063996 RepID=A0ABT9BCX7_9BACT|nr:hypothetical protein [Hymenobacter sp. ASUV-10]MDO7875513.1 hypothetical protein [Hymenobacter sp. ASUV-10]